MKKENLRKVRLIDIEVVEGWRSVDKISVAYFHKWVEVELTLPESNGSKILGLIETKDGIMKKYVPKHIQFISIT